MKSPTLCLVLASAAGCGSQNGAADGPTSDLASGGARDLAMRDPAAFAERWQPPSADLVPPNRFLPPSRSMMGTRDQMLSAEVLDW